MIIETILPWLSLAAVIAILTLGFGQLLDIIRGHDGKAPKEVADAAPEAPPAEPVAPETPET